MTEAGFGSGVGVFGKLGNVTLHDLIQMLSLGKRSATLTLRRGNTHGHMYFHDGHILHAEAGPFQGEDGILELLQWQDADFRIEEGVESLPRVTIGKRVDAVLLGTLTRLDRMNHDATRSDLRHDGLSGEGASFDREDDGSERETGATRPAHPLPTTRRYPRRPSRRDKSGLTRSLSAAALLLAAAALAAASFFVAPYAAAALAPWTHQPWTELPEIQTLATRAALPRLPDARDAWSMLAETNRLEPTPAPTAPVRELGPSAPTPPRPGFLTVVVEPWGRVWIDDRLIGETPLPKQELFAGEHQIRLENDNVVGLVQDRLIVGPGETLVRRYNFNHVGYLQFLVRPWAEVRVDGRPVGQTPLARLSVPVGSHIVVLEHPRFGRRERAVDVRADETTVVEVDWGADRRSISPLFFSPRSRGAGRIRPRRSKRRCGSTGTASTSGRSPRSRGPAPKSSP